MYAIDRVAPLMVVAPRTGAVMSPAALTVSVAVAGGESVVPSFTLYVNESGPL